MSQPTPIIPLQQTFEHSIAVREAALEAMREAKRRTERSLQSIDALARLHYVLIAIGGYLLGFVVFVPPLTQRLVTAGLLPLPTWAYFAFALIVWTLFIAPISGLVRKFTQQRPWWLLCYTLFGAPILLAVAERAVRNEWQGIMTQLIVWPLLSLILLCPLVVLLFVMGSSLPELLFLLLTSQRYGRSGRFLPSYESLLQDMLTALERATETYTEEDVERLAVVAQQKQTSLSSRLGALSLVFAAFALLGLFQLALGQEKVSAGLNTLFQTLLDFVNVSSLVATPLTGVLVTGLIVLALVVVGLRYATSAYRELRLLDAICLMCALHAHRSQTIPFPSTPAQHSTPSLASAQPNATLNVAGFFTGVAVSLLGIVLLLYHGLRRLLRLN